MTIQQLLETLIKKREAIDAAISEIYKVQANTTIRKKAARIVQSTQGPTPKGYKFNGTHWMQRPENKAKMMAMVKKMQKANKR